MELQCVADDMYSQHLIKNKRTDTMGLNGIGKYEKKTLPGLELSSDLYAWTPNSSKICKQHSES